MDFKRIFKRVIINGEVIAGENIEQVLQPECESPAWQIILKDGSIIDATGNISMWTVLK